MRFASRQHRRHLIVPVLIIFALLFVANHALAQDEPTPKGGANINGRVERGTPPVYRLGDLQAGDTLYAYVHTTAGNLDPALYLVDGDTDIMAAADEMWAKIRAAGASGDDPVAAYAAISDKLTLAWDDDSGAGYDAALAFKVPADGDYLLVTAASPAGETAGDFLLTLGINTPEVLTGKLTTVGNLNIELERPAVVTSVQEITGRVTMTDTAVLYRLVDMQIGDVLTAEVQTTSGDLVPVLVVEDYGGKALAADIAQDASTPAALSYTFTQNPISYVLRVAAAQRAATSTGEFRLRLGRNAPTALSEAEVSGPPVARVPIPVSIRLTIDQITGVDQRAENYGVVGNLRADWQDPALAFSPDSCNCQTQILRTERLIADYLNKNGINVWPSSYIYNQQGNRNAQTMLLAIDTDGSATYFERFTGTLQAPDFNFRQFPFDIQQFYVRVQSLFEEDYFTFEPDLANSGFGPQLGEEEWIFSNDAFTAETITVNNRSQAVFGFTTYRHLSFYIFRIFLPVLLIILVSWITFFLRDYGRRIEVTTGNLLLFIAYNFTIANDLPRIGYLTFLDVVLISTFIISALVIIVNVWFRRLEAAGKGEITERWDRFLIWMYPLLYIIGGLIVTLVFFWPF